MKKYIEIIGLQIILLMGITVLTNSVLLLLNMNISKYSFIFAIACSILFAFVAIFKIEIDHSKKVAWSLIVNTVFTIIVTLGIYISGIYYDISYDGQMYHQEAIIQLREGWNPLYDGGLAEKHLESGPVSKMSAVNISPNFWINHYTKGSYFFASSVYDLTNNLEQSKVGNWLLFVAAVLLTASLLLRIKVPNFWAITLSILVSLNPIVTNQLLTFYIDGQLGSLVQILLVLFISIIIENKIIRDIGIIFTLILLVNIKFTALVYAVILCMVPVLMTLYKLVFIDNNRNLKSICLTIIKQRYIYSIVIGLCLGVVLVGASSYITNLIQHQHPFYPLAGENKVDIMSHTTPEELKGTNRVESLYLSLFSQTSNTLEDGLMSKFPLSIKESELSTLWAMDIRIGGFGPLFGLIIICTMAGFILWRNDFKTYHGKMAIIVSAVIFLSAIVNPEVWWARYVPQLWIVPIIFLITFIIHRINRAKLVFVLFVSLTIGINSYLIQKENISMIQELNQSLSLQFSTLKEYSQTHDVFIDFEKFQSNRIRFNERGIDYIERDKKFCENPNPITFSNATFCVDDMELYNEIQMKYVK
ncbi:hypothetical protein [Lysinibacillus xylanilyticus]|uniref:hypothetical protein n=1 Tax=Lysinibacillus xylanilyticus TaxID=582475 RepID=UPI003CFD733A